MKTEFAVVFTDAALLPGSRRVHCAWLSMAFRGPGSLQKLFRAQDHHEFPTPNALARVKGEYTALRES